MPRQKSPHGRMRQILLRYREADPRYAAIAEVLQSVPDGEKNAFLLNALIRGLGVARSAPSNSGDHGKPPSPEKSRQEYGPGAVSVFQQF